MNTTPVKGQDKMTSINMCPHINTTTLTVIDVTVNVPFYVETQGVIRLDVKNPLRLPV